MKYAREKEVVKDTLLRMATYRKWEYIPAITITCLKSVRSLGSIMLYLMGSTANRMWHDIRGWVNIYPVRFLKCSDLQWPLYCPLHMYCRILVTATQEFLSSWSSNSVTAFCIQESPIALLHVSGTSRNRLGF